MKDPQRDPKLEAALNAALRKLPLHRAPESLAPRVLRLIARRQTKPWWQRAWWEWPLAAQVGFVAVTLLVAGVVVLGSWWLNENLVGQSAAVVEQHTIVNGWAGSLSELLANFAVWWGSYGQAWLIPGLVAVAVSYLFCLAGGTVLVRIATHSTVPSLPRRSGRGRSAHLFFT